VGTEVAVALRPEKVRISTQPLAEAPYNSVSGTIAEIAYLGDVSIYHVETISGPVVEATAANVLPSTEQPFTWDDRVHLWWTPNCGVVLLE
jgi:ABC-type Fe3+/spermidine/putrescine transport system ATPase subunit